MPGLVVVGTQWGDEGKGKVVDFLAGQKNVQAVVRFQGGPNAGHTLVGEDGRSLVLHQVACGVLRPGVQSITAGSTLVDPTVGLSDIAKVRSLAGNTSGIGFDARCPLILPYHVALDHLREAEASEGGGKIGTTGRGIGPATEDFFGRRSVPLGALASPDKFNAALARVLPEKQRLLRAYSDELFGRAGIECPDDIIGARWLEEFLARGTELAPHIRSDATKEIHDLLRRGLVIFEGAQGTHLDPIHGTWPYVTSQPCLSWWVSCALGVNPSLYRVLGVAKAYTTRVGEGPFPTELAESLGENLRTRGAEYGATTGRPRRCGWLDLPMVKRAVALNGCESIAITKLDVLTGISPIRVCTGYGKFDAACFYEDLSGWTEDITGIREWDNLPQNARVYVRFIEERVNAPVSMVSVGPRRDQMIYVPSFC